MRQWIFDAAAAPATNLLFRDLRICPLRECQGRRFNKIGALVALQPSSQKRRVELAPSQFDASVARTMALLHPCPLFLCGNSRSRRSRPMAVISRGDEVRFPGLALAGELAKKVPCFGEPWLHRDDARRRTIAEISVQVVRRAPLRRCRGLRPVGRRRGSFLSGSAAAMVKVDKASWLVTFCIPF